MNFIEEGPYIVAMQSFLHFAERRLNDSDPNLTLEKLLEIFAGNVTKVYYAKQENTH